jgi:hypothetical protein
MTTVINHKPTIFYKIKTVLKDIYSRSIYNQMLHHSQDPLEFNIFKTNSANQNAEGVTSPAKVEDAKEIGTNTNKSYNRKDINDDLPSMLFI